MVVTRCLSFNGGLHLSCMRYGGLCRSRRRTRVLNHAMGRKGDIAFSTDTGMCYGKTIVSVIVCSDKDGQTSSGTWHLCVDTNLCSRVDSNGKVPPVASTRSCMDGNTGIKCRNHTFGLVSDTIV